MVERARRASTDPAGDVSAKHYMCAEALHWPGLGFKHIIT